MKLNQAETRIVMDLFESIQVLCAEGREFMSRTELADAIDREANRGRVICQVAIGGPVSKRVTADAPDPLEREKILRAEVKDKMKQLGALVMGTGADQERDPDQCRFITCACADRCTGVCDWGAEVKPGVNL